jgi:sulfite exporter TauE/SafE
MSLWILLTTAGALGLLGGLHCVAMCSAMQRVAVHGSGGRRSPPDVDGPLSRLIPLRPIAPPGGRPMPRPGPPLQADLLFHAARLVGYAALGALVGGGSGLLRWGAEVMPVMRPLWGSLNALLLALGIALLVLGRQPAWIDALGGRIAAATGTAGAGRPMRPVAAGLAWALLPCGLLYSALATAALASEPTRGALAMLAFGAGTAVNLLAAQTVLRALGGLGGAHAARVEAAGVRAGGALLAAMATAALVALASGQPHPFCAPS